MKRPSLPQLSEPSPNAEDIDPALMRSVRKVKCEKDHLFFTRYFFEKRHGIRFRRNWHHVVIAEAVDKIIRGELKNVVFNLPPGGSKTELVVINLIARGLAINPNALFLHISSGDDLVLANSQSARDLIDSDEYQDLWNIKIASDAKAKKRWNVINDSGRRAGGVYAVALGGQITGFRAGRMQDGFHGAIIIDDPLKADDSFSKPEKAKANRRLISTVKSRRANPATPIIVVMQRLAQDDPTQFIKDGNLPGDWTIIEIPALIDDAYMAQYGDEIRALVDKSQVDEKGRYSYWQYKEPLKELLEMERGAAADKEGNRISRFVFASQYQQSPVALGGNLIRGEHFHRYKQLPKIKYRIIFADTAQKTAERNDYSVFECWGLGEDGRIYLLDMIRGKWEAPELEQRAKDFWAKHKPMVVYGTLRKMIVEDKSSGTGLIQKIRIGNGIPITGVERTKDKLTRVMDVIPYIEAGLVSIPEEAPFVLDFVAECEAFTADDSHTHDDQVDPMCDAINEMLGAKPKGFLDRR